MHGRETKADKIKLSLIEDDNLLTLSLHMPKKSMEDVIEEDIEW